MKTQDILDLVQEVLNTFTKPLPEDIIDQVCIAIWNNKLWHKRYEQLSKIHGKHILNNMIGRHVFNLSDFNRSGPAKPAKCPLLKTYKLLKNGSAQKGKPLYATIDLRKEQHFTINYGESGYTYEKIFGEYLKGAKRITIKDPYIRAGYQIENFIKFCELVVKIGGAKEIKLETKFDNEGQKTDLLEKFSMIKASLQDYGISLNVVFNTNIHDREVKLDNGWIIKIGRGFDIYQKPKNWFSVGAYDPYLRPCQETSVDIFRTGKN